MSVSSKESVNDNEMRYTVNRLKTDKVEILTTGGNLTIEPTISSTTLNATTGTITTGTITTGTITTLNTNTLIATPVEYNITGAGTTILPANGSCFFFYGNTASNFTIDFFDATKVAGKIVIVSNSTDQSATIDSVNTDDDANMNTIASGQLQAYVCRRIKNGIDLDWTFIFGDIDT